MLKTTILYYLGECIKPFILVAFFVVFMVLCLKVFEDDISMIISFVLVGISAAWFLWRFIHVIRAFRFNRLCWEKRDNDAEKKGVHSFEGGNRTGKSLNGHATLYYKALALWEDTELYSTLYGIIKLKRKLTAKEYLKFRELKESHKFYEKHQELIPHMVTNLRVKDKDGCSSMELTGRHLLQLDKLPLPAAVGLDESSSKVDIDLYKTREEGRIVDDFMRFYNHYTGDKSLFIFMEQNSARAYKGMRDSVQEVKQHKGVDSLLKPRRLQKRRDKYLKRFYKKFPKYSPAEKNSFAVRFLKLEKRIDGVGVLVLNFSVGTVTADRSGASMSDKITKEFLPCDLPYEYDNRFFRTGYQARKKKIAYSPFRIDLQDESKVDDRILVKKIGDGKGESVACYGDVPVKELMKEKSKEGKRGQKQKKEK